MFVSGNDFINSSNAASVVSNGVLHVLLHVFVSVLFLVMLS